MISDQDIPTTFPIFPLSGAVLFPQTRLPFYIFEPRYLSMIDAALAGARYVGMVQPRQSTQETVIDGSEIYEVGCLGRLTAFAETDDGRYMVTLMGITRFRIVSEFELKEGYRSVQANFKEFQPEISPADTEFDRLGFMETLKTYLLTLGSEENQETFEHADDQALVSTIALAAPFTPEEKQAILECPKLGNQARLMRSIMEMAAYSGDPENPRLKH